jgi:hypothetical protein
MRRMAYAFCVLVVVVSAATWAVAQHHGHGVHKGHGGHNGHGSNTADTRILVKFPDPLVEHTLANMRDHLVTLQEINDAMARGAFGEAGKIAEERLGLSSLKLHGAHEVAKYMPQGMQDAGTAMHRAASRFAIAAQNADVTGDFKSALKDLGEVMGACVGCHAGYKLR